MTGLTIACSTRLAATIQKGGAAMAGHEELWTVLEVIRDTVTRTEDKVTLQNSRTSKLETRVARLDLTVFGAGSMLLGVVAWMVLRLFGIGV